MGDPRIGKTDILQSSARLNPISSYGLGTGTTGISLAINNSENVVTKGLIPMADKGLCAINELNIIRQRDLPFLFSAMDKGLISFNIAEKHYKFDARVKIIASGSPKTDKFVGWTKETIMRQVPFEFEMLSRFHLIFLIRRVNIKNYIRRSVKIVTDKKENILTEDEKFIRDYVEYAMQTVVELPNDIEKEIVNIAAIIKKDEKKYIQEFSKHEIIGLIRMAKASARMKLSKIVTKEDLDFIKEIVVDGLRLYE